MRAAPLFIYSPKDIRYIRQNKEERCGRMKKKTRKLLSIVLALVMVFSLLPVNAATEDNKEETMASVEEVGETSKSGGTRDAYAFDTQPESGSYDPGTEG